MKKLLIVSLLLVAGAVLLIPVGGDTERDMTTDGTVESVDTISLSGYSDEAPGAEVRLLFIHHSCGGQWLADPGEDVGKACIYESHPNGGGLRTVLEADGYRVHEASYGSLVGNETDLHHWAPKFRDQMDEVLACSHQDDSHPPGTTNDVVMFKPCFPNSGFEEEGNSPGNAESERLTVWNAKAAYQALLPLFAKHPEVLYVCVTAPPLVPRGHAEPLWKVIARKVLNRPSQVRDWKGEAALARRFNNWLKSTAGWLADYEGTNVVVFDHYDILTGEGRSNLGVYGSGPDGSDSHPSREGNQLATDAFRSFLNRAARRAGIGETVPAGE